ncbi:MAG: DUF488 family protein [Candidatus Nitrosopolaris sp.]
MLKLKSLKEPTSGDDGLRIMIARYRKRYLPKHEENWNEWWKDLAPSKVLFKEFMQDKKISWSEYEGKFRLEIRNNPKSLNALSTLRTLIKDKSVTILCHCIDEKHCHRSLIKQMIEEEHTD